jgi:hypothetical protein
MKLVKGVQFSSEASSPANVTLEHSQTDLTVRGSLTALPTSSQKETTRSGATTIPSSSPTSSSSVPLQRGMII